MAQCHGQLYQKIIKRAFDKKVRPHAFEEGHLVLKTMQPNAKDPRGKWTPNYKGPYMVKCAFTRKALILLDSDEQEL
ncbi:hypothetical protein CR513_52335, partial [Mucuna pruriens]